MFSGFLCSGVVKGAEGVDHPRRQSAGGGKNGCDSGKNDKRGIRYLVTFGGGKIAVHPGLRLFTKSHYHVVPTLIQHTMLGLSLAR